jgi:hypothetical protein
MHNIYYFTHTHTQRRDLGAQLRLIASAIGLCMLVLHFSCFFAFYVRPTAQCPAAPATKILDTLPLVQAEERRTCSEHDGQLLVCSVL